MGWVGFEPTKYEALTIVSANQVSLFLSVTFCIPTHKKSATKRLRGKDLFNFQLSREYNSQTTARAFAKHPFKRIITVSVIISLNYVPVLRIVPSKEPLHVLRVRLEELFDYNREFQARSSESNMIVNGPSLVSEIFMSAPKIPV